MNRIIILLTSFLLSESAFSQQLVCIQDTVHFYQANYRGQLSWQRSDNGSDWSTIMGSQRDTIMVVATNTAYYRTEITEGLCMPVYSDIVHLIVNELPVVSLELRDSVCLNEQAFVLSGGIPADGLYWGNGVIDSKFWPSAAGPGLHEVYYQYRDSQTHCADTASAWIVVSDNPNQANAGSDLPFIAANSVTLDGNIPENGIGTWTIINGSSGHFSDIHSAQAIFVKDSSNLEFTLRWTISGKCGNSSDDVDLSFFKLSKNPCPNAPTVTDADGNIYPTVQIGNQCWMAENLNVGKFVHSTKDIIDHSNLSNNGIIEKYCLYNKTDSCKLYGGLYDWNEAMGYTDDEGARGICPEGWHIPTVTDWNILDAQFKWNTAALQIRIGGESGFEAYFAGDRNASGDFYSNGSSGFFWVSGSYIYEGINEGYVREIDLCKSLIVKKNFTKKAGFSVRCIKNN